MINTQEIINNKYRVRPTKAFNFSDLSSKGGVWLPPQYNKTMEIIISDGGDEQEGMHITLIL